VGLFKKEKSEIQVKFGGPCCFCGKEIPEDKIDPCSVTVETKEGQWQVWYCHSKCFKDRITKDAPLDLSPAHF